MADIPRIKSNIGLMIDQGAPESDIDAYIASEGVSTRDLHAVSTGDQAKDVAKSAGVGAAKGGISILGGAGDLRELLSMGTDYAGQKLGVDPEKVAGFKKTAGDVAKYTTAGRVMSDAPTSRDIQSKIEGRTGEFYKPQTTAGKYAQTVGEFIPAAAAGPGRMVPKLVSALAGGLGSEAAGQATEGTKAEPYARVLGAVAGGLTPHVASRAVTPLPASPARQRLVDILADEGVTSLTAGQRTGNKALQYGEDMLGNAPGAGGSATNIRQRGQEQFTEAAMRRAGAGPDATPEVLAGNQDRLGQQFRDLSARNDLTPDNQFVTDVVAAARNYRRVPDSQQRQMVQGYIDDIVAHVNTGNMPGAQYQEMRSRLSRQANSLRNSDPTLSEALRDMRNALDNAMGRSISPADREAWQTARREYGAQKTIEKTASRAGEATAEGQLVPANLRNTVSAENRGAYARGEGQFSELARAGSGVMAPLPNSGTAQRLNATNIAMLPVTATIGRALMSRPAQAYLGNQAMSETIRNLPPARRAALIALLNEQNAARIEGPRE
jgi:hypothetical protein